MNRKTFLRTVVALPVGMFLVSCTSSSNGGTSNNDAGNSNNGGNPSNAPGAAPKRNGTQTIYTSSNNSSHVHAFTIDDTAFATPPSAGVSGDTSNNSGHTHTVTVSMDELDQVAAGETVTVTTSNVSGHTHVFTFVKIA